METIKSVKYQRDLLGEALLNILIFDGMIREDIESLTGPELLLAAETYMDMPSGFLTNA